MFNRIPYRKDWIVSTGIARGILGSELDVRIPTINEYTEIFDCSRGLVQDALTNLQTHEAINLDKRGKHGTFLIQKDEGKLFDAAKLHFFTGSMPAPLNMHLAGLATGICQTMARSPVPFTFAFVQGAKNRMDALCREIYDFVVVTRTAAQEYMKHNSELEEAFPLTGCEYSPPYNLYINKPGVTQIEDGMTIAIDSSSIDQSELTKLVCQCKNVRIIELHYIPATVAFFSGELDAVVLRGDLGATQSNLYNMAITAEKRMSTENISTIPIIHGYAADIQLPVVLVNKNYYGIAGILKNYLGGELVSYIQQRVIQYKMSPQFY